MGQIFSQYKNKNNKNLTCKISSGPPSASVSPAVIKDANEAVRSATQSKPRGKHAKFTPEQQAAIDEYASLDGNQAAIHHFSKKLGVEMNVSLGSDLERKVPG